MPPDDSTPLSSWSFTGTLRGYQADVLERVDAAAAGPLHLVAPPGSGKTLLGLLLAVRRGHRAVVLAPTTAIRDQWAETALSLSGFPAEPGAGSPVDLIAAESTDPETPGALTALTYQSLSVLDSGNPFAALARRRWRDELEADARTPDAAEAWLAQLHDSNPRAYRRGIASRSRTVRRQLAREDAEVLSTALHPNARALIDRLVAHGVETIVLDECHHLLDHWALVVAALAARIRAAGREPFLVGLTATLPSPDDANEYENYTNLLGDVDVEVPVPAVVREGDLSPYRDHVHFVEPTPDELGFLGAHAQALTITLGSTFSQGTGLDFLVDTLQPAPPPAPERDELEPPPPPVEDSVDTRLAAAFSADFAAAEAAAAMLATVAPQHPLVARLPSVAHRAPTTDESLRLLARFALDRVLPDPAHDEIWKRLRRMLADFGYALTDRGVRRTRDPVDTLLASSLAKDFGAADVLRIESEALGDRLRALVVTDFARHGNKHGGLVSTAGALRTFTMLVGDVATSHLRGMLVTGGSVRLAARDSDALVPALERLLGSPLVLSPVEGALGVVEVDAAGVGSARFVRAASALLTEGLLHYVVGTRGLFGEGWDCPAVNTLIDLTAVATPSATQQLRGRTLRLDPAWHEKVAHNWTVTTLLPPGFPLEAQPEASRLRRKHERLWGLDRDQPDVIVRGLSIALSADQAAALSAVLEKRAGSSIAGLNDLRDVPDRALTREQWRVGEHYLDHEAVSALVPKRLQTPVFRTSVPAARALGGSFAGVSAVTAASAAALSWTGAALAGPEVGVIGGVVAVGAGLIPAVELARGWWQARRQTRPDLYSRIAHLVWSALSRGGVVSREAAHIVVSEIQGLGGAVDLSIGVPDASHADQKMLAIALKELFGPVRTPRFLLETGRGGRSAIVRSVLGLAARRDPEGHLLPVPAAIGRQRAGAEAFATEWQRRIGPCILHEMSGPDQLAVLARARRARGGAGEPVVREQWR